VSAVTANLKHAGDPELRRVLGLDAKRPRVWLRRALILLVVVGAAVGGTFAWRRFGARGSEHAYQTQAVERGDLHVTVTATGKLDAIETVDVGAEVSGRILEVLVDFNDPVKKGQVLAKLDTESLRSRKEEATAQVRAARAAEHAARSTAREAHKTELRSLDLAAKGLISQQTLESAIASAERARANVDSAVAQTALAEAGLREAQNSLSKATITAPIDGVVLARNVEAGQTLASSFQVPVLFKIAKDLREMELSIHIDEADIGRVREGQVATFTVDAYPEREFASKVVSLRNVPTIEQNVVTYEALLSVDNSERLLRPGMTATATVITEEKLGVVLVPNAALRFIPPEEAKKEAEEAAKHRVRIEGEAKPRQRVWLLGEEKPRAVEIAVGATDGTRSEVTGGDLEPGTELIVDLRVEEPAK
jgi:HlyD family secretion protein